MHFFLLKDWPFNRRSIIWSSPITFLIMCTSLLNLVFLYKWRCWSILSPFNFLKQLVHLFYLLINLSFFTLILLVIFLFFEKFLKALSKRLFKLFCYLLVLDLCLHPLYLHHTWVSWHLLLILTLPSISSWFQFFLYTVFLNILFLVFIQIGRASCRERVYVLV